MDGRDQARLTQRDSRRRLVALKDRELYAQFVFGMTTVAWNMKGSMSFDAPGERGRKAEAGLAWHEKLTRKVIGAGGRVFFGAAPLLYRFQWPWRGKLGPIDHITIPTTDLIKAERFFVGVLGARVVLRVTEGTLKRMGWSGEEITRNQAPHISLTLGGGPRLDLFEYPLGIPSEPAMHPHIAITVAPGKLDRWKDRLLKEGVVVAGPMRAGPPGHASLYFNDPFGNHFELVTIGYVASELPVGMPDRSKLNYAWRECGAAGESSE